MSNSAPTSNFAIVRRLLGLAWKYRWGCLGVLLLQGVLLANALAVVQLTGLGIDLVRFAVGDTLRPPEFPFGWSPPSHWTPLQQVAAVAAAVLICALARATLNYVHAVASGKLIHEQIVVDLRRAIYDKLQRLSFRYYDANATGAIINRVTGDVQAVRSFVDGVLIQLVVLLLTLVCYVFTMARLHVGLTIVCLLSTPLLWVLTIIFSRMVRPAYDLARELSDRMVLRLAENIQGVQVVKGFGCEPEEIDRFTTSSRELRDQQQGIFWKVSTFTPTIGLLTQANLVVLLAYGGYLVAQHQLALGTGLVVFAGLLQQFHSQVSNLSVVANSVQQSLSGARRVFEILDAPVEVASAANAVRLERARGEVKFERVSFGYSPEHRVLHEVEFTARPGDKIALLGATGAGKTTLLSLLCRFYDPLEGRITLDGHDLKSLDLADLRRNLGIVFQESFLFSHSVAANIAFGNPFATRAQVETAARLASAHEFIEALPEGYDTVLGEWGQNLSGGQRQRLAIARALLLDPPVLVLDDPAAAIDPQTEREILDSLRQAMQGRTTFIVAHRLSTLRHADYVAVLEAGRLVQFGTPTELHVADGHFRNVALLQGVRP